MTHAVIYARVSSKEQEQEGYSIPSQLSLLRGYAIERGFTIAREFVDVETAKHAGRPGFEQMLAHIVSEDACNVILVEKTDRLYRNLRDYVTLDEMKPEIHFVKENFVLSDASRSTEKFMHGIKVLMAKNYIDNLSEEASKGMREKAEQGTWPSVAPLGYRNVEIGDKRGIGIDADRAAIITRMFEWYGAGNCSLAEVRERAIHEGLTTTRSRPPSKSTVERILKNLFYVGMFRWRGKTYEGDHPPLVTMELFQRVQQAFRKGNHPVQEKKRSFAYTGLIKCARCGCSITAGRHKGKYVYYHCTQARGKCGTSSIREDRLEALLGELVQSVQVDEETIDWIAAALKDSHRDEKAYHKNQMSRLQGEVKKAQARMDAAYDDKLDGQISEAYWKRKSREWQASELDIMQRIEAHQRASHLYLEAGVNILHLAQRAYPLWLSQPQNEKRRLLDLLLLNCTFDGTSLTATYAKPFCWLAEGSVYSIWRGIQDDFADFLRSEQCLQLARAVG